MKKTYEFENLGCAHCAGKMEEKIGKLPEVSSVNLSFPMKKMYVETSSEDLLPAIQKICTDIEPDVIVTEVTKKSSKRRRHTDEASPEHHEHHHEHGDHCDCGCDHDHEGHEHHHHHDHDEHCDCGCDHDHEEHEHHHHHHDHDEHCDCGCDHDHDEHEHHHHHHDHDDHCDCGCCDDDDDDDDEPIAAAANRQGNGQETVFIVENLGCAHCAGKMEEQISHLPDVEAVNLTYATKQLRVWSDDAVSLLPKIQDICTSIEPDVKVVVRENTVRAQKEAKKAKDNSEDHKEYWELGAGIVLFIAGKALESSKPVYSAVCFVLAYLILGIKIVWTALKNISKGQVFDENFLMSIATIGAFGVGEYAEAVGVMLFYRIGELFEEKAVERSRSQIMDVIDMRPEVVNLVDEHGDATTIDAEEAEIDDILLVRPGDRIPLDGVITDGETMIDTSPVTGEPVPVSASIGSEVTSGCLNTSGVIKIRVEKVLEESMVTRIMDSVENAAASKPKMDRFITRFSRVYTPFVVCLALATAIIPSLVTGNWTHWVYTALTFLVISCPCALVLSVPLAFFSGIGAGSKIGILFKGGAALETLKDVTSVVMDKTGTITKGNFKVQDVITTSNLSKNEVLSLAASCEESSTHPIGKSIMEAAKEENVSYKAPENAKEIAGHGSVITIDGSEILAGNKKLMSLYHVTGEYSATTSYGTEVFLAKDGVLIGSIVIADTLKDDAKSAIASLKAQKLHTVMLTGDSETTANAIAKETGIDEVYSRLLPDEKLAKLQEQRSKHGAVMFVGDGINDAPVLAGADCGAAMGSGADAAIEAADVVFMTSSVEAIPQAISIGKKASTIAWQNVVFALAVKALVMILGLLGFANMWMAVFADTGVAMICVLNSIRALKL
jgi:Cd2+/Zn2+-exporting ATPase